MANLGLSIAVKCESALNQDDKNCKVLIKEECVIDENEDSLSYDDEKSKICVEGNITNKCKRLQFTTIENPSSVNTTCGDEFNPADMCNVVIKEECIEDDEDNLLYYNDIELCESLSDDSINNEPMRKSAINHEVEDDQLSSHSSCIEIIDCDDENPEYTNGKSNISFTDSSVLSSFQSQRISSYIKHNLHNATEPAYKCSECEYSAVSKYKLNLHKTTHSYRDRPFKCTYCQYSASTKGTLQQHLRLHTGEKPYKCSQCNFSATQKCALESHMRHHTGERPFKCTQCDYSAYMKGTLKQHVKMHSGHRPYKCSLCNFSAARSSSVEAHMSFHSGGSLLKCTHCNYSAYMKHILKQHMTVHTGGTTRRSLRANNV